MHAEASLHHFRYILRATIYREMKARVRSWSKGSRINMHLSQDLLEIVGWPVDWMRVNPFISCYHNTFISGLALHLFLHIAPLVCALIVASACRKLNNNNWWSKWMKYCMHVLFLSKYSWDDRSMYIPCMENMHICMRACVHINS